MLTNADFNSILNLFFFSFNVTTFNSFSFATFTLIFRESVFQQKKRNSSFEIYSVFIGRNILLLEFFFVTNNPIHQFRIMSLVMCLIEKQQRVYIIYIRSLTSCGLHLIVFYSYIIPLCTVYSVQSK